MGKHRIQQLLPNTTQDATASVSGAYSYGL